MKCAFLSTKIAASFETAIRNLLKSVKDSEKVRSKGYGPLSHSKQNSLPGLPVKIMGSAFFETIQYFAIKLL